MHDILLYLHVASVLTFMLAHGASAAVAFRLKKTTELHEARTLLDLSSSTFNVFYGAFSLILITGVWMGFIGHHWRQLWIWTALGIFVMITVVMYTMASPHFTALRKAAGLPYYGGGMKPWPAEEPRVEEVTVLLASNRPILVSGIGFAGILLILGLMLFKPF